MQMHARLAIFTPLLLAATVALAQTPGAAPAVVQPTATPAKAEKVVCRSSKQIGSLTSSVRRCHTLREWADLRQQTREKTEELQVFRDRTEGG